jgi:hypothetical protein
VGYGPKGLKEETLRLLAEGLSQGEIASRLGCTPQSVSWHARRNGYGKPANQYEWTAIRAFYDEGHTAKECRERFQFSSGAWFNAIERGDIVPRQKDLDSYGKRGNFRRRILAEGLLEYCCARCGISEWMGETLTLQLHHKNGKNKDHRIENVEFLCPNCHSQTENFGARNRS